MIFFTDIFKKLLSSKEIVDKQALLVTLNDLWCRAISKEFRYMWFKTRAFHSKRLQPDASLYQIRSKRINAKEMEYLQIERRNSWYDLFNSFVQNTDPQNWPAGVRSISFPESLPHRQWRPWKRGCCSPCRRGEGKWLSLFWSFAERE